MVVYLELSLAGAPVRGMDTLERVCDGTDLRMCGLYASDLP